MTCDQLHGARVVGVVLRRRDRRGVRSVGSVIEASLKRHPVSAALVVLTVLAGATGVVGVRPVLAQTTTAPAATTTAPGATTTTAPPATTTTTVDPVAGLGAQANDEFGSLGQAVGVMSGGVLLMVLLSWGIGKVYSMFRPSRPRV